MAARAADGRAERGGEGGAGPALLRAGAGDRAMEEEHAAQARRHQANIRSSTLECRGRIAAHAAPGGTGTATALRKETPRDTGGGGGGLIMCAKIQHMRTL